jgi:hypothetical protein
MFLNKPNPLPSIPLDTQRIAHRAFSNGCPSFRLGDELGAIFSDEDFADLYLDCGQSAYAPWRLATIWAKIESEDGKKLYQKRAGLDETLSQNARAFELRQPRYIGLAKIHL